MRHVLASSLVLVALLSAHPAEARNTEYHLAIADVLHDPDFAKTVGGDVAFYFASQAPPPTAQDFGAFVTNRKTNSFAKSDESACRWAMLSALKQLRERAVELGGDAVVNIVSYYKKNPSPSETTYECHAGGVIAGVALKGTIVKLRP